jgi:hypothetical protein
MQLDPVTVQVRPRGRLESCDLGFAMVRENWREIGRAWAVTVIPLMLLANVLAWWWPAAAFFAVWWLKPLYDRIALWVLSRRVFGASAGIDELRRDLPTLLFRTQLFRDLTYRRINVQRSFDLPVTQLERQTGAARRARLRSLRRQTIYTAQGLTIACAQFETVLYWSWLGIMFIMVPQDVDIDLESFIWGTGMPLWFDFLKNALWSITICIVEPFYVGAGFALYLNRRTWLEGWDLEIAFRRMAAADEALAPASTPPVRSVA